ncbi:MAG TPA: hypothetical protein VM165_15030 [Planctomycetaceae bacterium]|nr:hypothetical protein [Planctomycetaceae bacterium]
MKAALGEIATIDPGTDPTTEEQSDCLLRLNGMLKSWSLKGVSLYRETSVTITTTPATAAVTLSAGIRNISSARLVVSATNERLLWPWSRADYLTLPNKTAAGSPTIYYLDRQRAAGVVYFWPVSATAASIKLDYDRIPETITAGTQTVDIREELQETVYANLAVRIAGLFGQQASAELIARAGMLEQAMFDAERPDSYQFVYDCA